MKVRDLLQALINADLESDVILQTDAEGNGYLNVRGIDSECVWDSKQSIVYSTECTADDNCLSEKEWSKLLKQRRCVVLYP